jgi:hypothetical protein
VTNEIFLYVLALAARRSGVLVDAFCVLSNPSDRTDVRRRPGPAGCVFGPSGALAGARGTGPSFL